MKSNEHQTIEEIPQERDDMYVTCHICGRNDLKQIASHLKTHGLTTTEYRDRYPKAILTSEATRQKISESLSGKNHPNFGKITPESTRKKISEAMEGDKNPNYGKKPSESTRQKLSDSHTGKKLSKEHRKKLSKALEEGYRTGKREVPKHGSGKAGVRGDLGQFFRSNYEANIARILNYHQIRWLYEPKRFDLGKYKYRPDFYLPDKDLWIEVKGWIRPETEEKVAYQIREFNKDHKLLVIDEKKYSQLEQKYKPLISEWDQMKPPRYNLSQLLIRKKKNIKE